MTGYKAHTPPVSAYHIGDDFSSGENRPLFPDFSEKRCRESPSAAPQKHIEMTGGLCYNQLNKSEFVGVNDE